MRGHRANQAKNVFASCRVEAVVDDGVGGVLRGRCFHGWVADAQFAVIADPQFAANLQRDARKALMRTHATPPSPSSRLPDRRSVRFRAAGRYYRRFWLLACT